MSEHGHRHDRHGRHGDRRRGRSPTPNPADAVARRMEDVLTRWAEASTNLQEQNSDVLRRVSDVCLAARNAPGRDRFVKLQSFDGTSLWSVFLAQFQSAAQSSGWDDAVQGRRLLSALKGPAADLVQTLPPAEYSNFASLSARLQEPCSTPHCRRG